MRHASIPTFVASLIAASVAFTALTPAHAQNQGQGSATTPKTCSELAGAGRAFTASRLRYDNDIIRATSTVTAGKLRRIANQVVPHVLASGMSPRRQINTVLRNRPMFRQFYGTPGLLMTIILRAARDYMFVSGGPFDLELRPFGRIDQDGYRLNNDMSGFIKNTMCFEVWRGSDHVATYRYQVKIDVAKCGFSIIERAPDGTWPGSYIEESLAGVDQKYQYKLQAVALGRFSSAQYDGSDCTPDDRTAPVMSVGEIKIDTGNGNLVNLRDTANNAPYRQMLVSGCFDIFFEERPPRGTTLDTLNPAYCLGRCRRPLIVNTGA